MSSMTMADIFRALAAAHPDRLAAVGTNREFSYRNLVARSGQYANVLAKRGVVPGAQIGIALRDNVDTLLVMLALWLIDAVPVPLDFRGRGEQRASAASDFGLAAIIEDRPSGGEYSSITLDEAFAQEASAGSSEVPEQAGVPHAALISLTSGTTGSPVGVVFEHSALIARAQSFGLETPNYPHGGKLVMAYPLAFSASRSHVFGMLVTGGTVYFHPPTFGALELVARVNQVAADMLFAVPATVSAMLAAIPPSESVAMPSLSLLYCGSAGMAPADKISAAQRLSAGFLHCFATSLAGTCAVLQGEDIQQGPDRDGRIIATVRCQAVDADDKPVPDGEVGQLRVRSTSTVASLVGPERQGSDRVRDGWAYSGDLVRISADGFLTVVGRTSDMIIRSGSNVYPAEVEKVIDRVAGVSESAVVGVPDAETGEEVVAFVVGAATVTSEALIAHCRLELPPDKRPRRFVFVDSLPRSTTGKVLKRELRDSLLASPPQTQE